MVDLAERLASRTLELVDIPSESRNEERVREHVLGLVPPSFKAEYAAEDAFLFARPRRTHVPFVILAGHYDTVPAQGNLPGQIAAGAVHGVGATDMKGGLAVAIELVRDLATRKPGSVDVGLLVFGKEELPAEFSPLPDLFARSRLVHEADLAILLEPTDLTVQAGCLGNMSATVTFHGVSGHSARPWLAENAIDRAVEGLAKLTRLGRREVSIGGLSFFEVISVTRISAGIADNVIPDSAVATLNFRYPADRTPASAETYLRGLLPRDADVIVTGNSAPAKVVTEAPLVHKLAAVGGLAIEPKQAWTNVADFTAEGIDAINFGPGATRYAHRRDELVEIASLVRSYETLDDFLSSP
jgi:succinyl-diaminopimelate desuccinylase